MRRNTGMRFSLVTIRNLRIHRHIEMCRNRKVILIIGIHRNIEM